MSLRLVPWCGLRGGVGYEGNFLKSYGDLVIWRWQEEIVDFCLEVIVEVEYGMTAREEVVDCPKIGECEV